MVLAVLAMSASIRRICADRFLCASVLTLRSEVIPASLKLAGEQDCTEASTVADKISAKIELWFPSRGNRDTISYALLREIADSVGSSSFFSISRFPVETFVVQLSRLACNPCPAVSQSLKMDVISLNDTYEAPSISTQRSRAAISSNTSLFLMSVKLPLMKSKKTILQK